MKHLHLLAFFILFSFSCKKTSSKQVLTDNQLVSENDKMVDAAVRGYAAKETTAGFSIALIEHASGPANISFYNYGELEAGAGQLPTSGTAYEIGSITKTFTAVSMVTHAIESLGTNFMALLNANLADYLPAGTGSGFTLNGSSSRVLQLLNHTSGLPRLPEDLASTSGYDAANPYAHYDVNKVYSYLSIHPPAYTPGEQPLASNLEERYSNLAYSVAGIILGRQKQLTLDDLFRQQLFGGGRFGFSPMATGYGDFPGAAKSHDQNGRPVAYWSPMGGFAGAGGLKSTAQNMAQMLDAYLVNGTPSSTIQPSFALAMNLCTTPTVLLNGEHLFGLGWEFVKLGNGKELVVKDGATGGSTAFVAFHKSSGKALVLLTNNHNGNGQAAVFLDLAEKFFK